MMKEVSERINIVPIISAEKRDNSIINTFDTISFRQGTKGEFCINFLVNSLIDKEYYIKYLLIRISESGPQALTIDNFLFPDIVYKSKKVHSETKENIWSFSKKKMISGITTVKVDYSKISIPGEYGIVAFIKEKKSNETDDLNKIELKDMELVCEKHFWVEVLD